MKIFANIPGALKLVYCLKYLKPYKKGIAEARVAGDTELEREYITKATSVWANTIFDMFGTKVNVTGLENLPDKGPVVFVGNHQGYADILAYCAVLTKFQFGFVAKDELAKIPLYGEWIRRIRSVFIERDDPRASLKAINEGIGLIEQGFSLTIFPEGTRSKGPEMNEFKKGALKLATKPGVPIIPISLNGSYRMFEDQGYLKGTTIDFIIHEPIETAGLSRKEEKELSDKVEKIVVDGVKALQNK